VQSKQSPPRHDDPGEGLTEFGKFVNKVLGVDSCQCLVCQLEPASTVRVAVQCTAIQYEYTAYGNTKLEDIITIDLGKPVF
jgi:hypothetical protein